MNFYQRPTFTVLEMCAEEHIVTTSGEAELKPSPWESNKRHTPEDIWDKEDDKVTGEIWSKE